MIILTPQNFQTIHQQVIDSQKPSELPEIFIPLTRPIMTFNFALLSLMSIFGLFIVATSLLQFLIQGLSSFTSKMAFFIPFVMLLFVIIIVSVEFKTQKIKLFSLHKNDVYFCRLTSDCFEWVCNDENKKLKWRQIFIIEKYSTHRMEQARVFLGIENDKPLIIYHNHLPFDYRKIWQLLYDYQLKALGKSIINIQ